MQGCKAAATADGGVRGTKGGLKANPAGCKTTGNATLAKVRSYLQNMLASRHCSSACKQHLLYDVQQR